MFEKKPLVATTVSIWNMHDKIHNQVNCLNRLARSEVNAGHGAPWMVDRKAYSRGICLHQGGSKLTNLEGYI